MSDLTSSYRLARYAAISTLLGVVLSGPPAVLLVNLTHPQPDWQGAEVFARHYHPIQNAPYLGGLFLVGGLCLLIGSLQTLASDRHRALATTALVFSGAFASSIFFNYVIQTTFVPVLAHDYSPENAALLGAFSMVNPKSLSWAIEMWGWAFLGVATALVAPVFDGTTLERAARWSFLANAPISIAGALWTVLVPGWIMSTLGLVLFSLWNLLVVAMAILTIAALNQRA